jgi:hypothetical protein
MQEKSQSAILISLLAIATILIVFNQYQVSALSSQFDSAKGSIKKGSIWFGSSGDVQLDNVDVTQITSTAMALKSLFPELSSIQTEEDAISAMLPTGTPDYSEALGGITFDDPVTSMEYLAKWYYTINNEVKTQNPEVWQRYLNLAAKPTGISCEYCCGIGPQGIDSQGNSRCGCAHNPALLALTQGLMLNTDLSDAEVLREVMKWKTMFFPKNMIGLSMEVAGKDASELASLPGMVGGC